MIRRLRPLLLPAVSRPTARWSCGPLAAFAVVGIIAWIPASTLPAQAPRPPSKSGAPIPSAVEEPSYFVIPFKGSVGKELVAQKVKEAMDAGLKDPRTVLVLDFDSPGGLISECEAILELLAAQKERRSIAFIKNAYSAAAILALSCDEIYMLENSSIGSAQAVTITTQIQLPPPPALSPPRAPAPARPQPPGEAKPPGASESPKEDAPKEEKPPQPPSITEAHEKLQSVWRSICRRAAEVGGHSPLIAEAMANPEIQIRLVEKDGQRVVEQFLEAREEDVKENRVIKTKGRLLTLTGSEAVHCRLAAGIVSRLGEIENKAPGLTGWKPVNDRGVKIMDGYRSRLEKSEKTFQQLAVKVNDELKLAIAEDPANVTYGRDPTGNLTPAGYDLLVKQCTKCATHLARCESALKEIAELGKSNPFLAEEAKAAQVYRVSLKMARERVRQFAGQFRAPALKKLGL